MHMNAITLCQWVRWLPGNLACPPTFPAETHSGKPTWVWPSAGGAVRLPAAGLRLEARAGGRRLAHLVQHVPVPLRDLTLLQLVSREQILLRNDLHAAGILCHHGCTVEGRTSITAAAAASSSSSSCLLLFLIVLSTALSSAASTSKSLDTPRQHSSALCMRFGRQGAELICCATVLLASLPPLCCMGTEISGTCCRSSDKVVEILICKTFQNFATETLLEGRWSNI